MGSRKKEKLYSDLGSLLELWREPKFRSALALYKEGKFSFSYSAYADFERGTALPPIEALLEIATFHGQDVRDAALLWAQVQMPNDDLKALFRSRSKPRDSKPQANTESAAKSTHQPSLDNTWVFSQKDREFFEKSPWLSDLCLALITAYPGTLTFEQLGFRTKKGFKKFKSQYLKDWIEQGHVIEDGDALKLAKPHYHFPKSDDWNDLRNQFFARMSGKLTREMVESKALEKRQATRILVNRTLSSKQMERWCQRTQDLELEFLTEPYAQDGSMYTLMVAFGERRMTLPKEVVETCEN